MPGKDHEWYSFNEAVQFNEELEQLLKSHSIGIERGSALERMSLSILEVFYRHRKSILTPESIDPRSSLIESMGLSDLARKILRVKDHPKFEMLVPHLRLLNNGEIAQNRPVEFFDDASNKIFELLVCCCLMTLHSEVVLDPPDSAKGDNPDILFQRNGTQIGIACKTMLSRNPKSIFDNIAKGVDQIEKSPAQIGYVFVNLKNVMDHDKYWRILEPDKYSIVSEPRFTCFTSPQVAFQTIMDDANHWSSRCSKEVEPKDWNNLFLGKRARPCVVFMLQTACTVRMYKLSPLVVAVADLPVPTTLGTLSIMPIGSEPMVEDVKTLSEINFAFHNVPAPSN